MYLTSFDPFTWDFQRQFNRLSRQAFGSSRAMPMDAVREENGAVLTFDVPGIDPESIEVTVDRGVLSVSVKRQEERAEDGKFVLRERTTGTFTRRVYLSENLDADAIDASYHNGVLEVRIPVLEQAKPRKIEIRQPDGQDGQKELAS
jgi:HSP20 family protein